LSLVETAFTTASFEDLSDRFLPAYAGLMRSPAAFLYILDAAIPGSHFYHYGFGPEEASATETECTHQLDRLSSKPDLESSSLTLSTGHDTAIEVRVRPLRVQNRCVGLLGAKAQKNTISTWSEAMNRLVGLLALTIERVSEQIELRRRIKHLNTYLTISSTLVQSLDLHGLLEIALYSCMEAVSAEAASVLLLDDEKTNFQFYQVEGPAKPILTNAKFPANQGLAGSVLQRKQSEIVSDVAHDDRFYRQLDSQSGFRTRNMIVIPLVAGEEEVGVLEVLNKAGEGCFTEEERLLLVSVAEEIAFAIRNAKVFEYVVNTYCKIRQGKSSCKGCKRPLGSWTPCVKYRDAAI
jgi:putative methionine-R-sulfoxide reductase with GAF domain